MPSRKLKSRKSDTPIKGKIPRASRKIADLIREKRIEKNLSQSELADMVGYESPQYISDWERAYSAVPMAKFTALSKILGLDRDRLFDFFLDFSKERLERQLRQEYRELTARRG